MLASSGYKVQRPERLKKSITTKLDGRRSASNSAWQITKRSHSFPWTEHSTYPLQIHTIMTNTKFTKRLANLINQIESHDYKEELIKLIGDQVSDDTVTLQKEIILT